MMIPEASRNCGLVMPISPMNNYTLVHWADVRRIINEAVESAGFTCRMVSEADDVGVIQKRIIQNLYECPIVVCDVSGRNPNVMFELGMRLAFDKPVVIVKDELTPYSFDTGIIEHIDYPHDLRYASILEFKERLSSKIKETYAVASSDPSYSAFLKQFGTFKVAKIDEQVVSGQEAIVEELKSIRLLVENSNRHSGYRNALPNNGVKFQVPVGSLGTEEINKIINDLEISRFLVGIGVEESTRGSRFIVGFSDTETDAKMAERRILSALNKLQIDMTKEKHTSQIRKHISL